MGFDWEELLGAEGEELESKYNDNLQEDYENSDDNKFDETAN